MKNIFNGSARKWKGLSFATTLIALSAVVLAWNINWNAPVSLVIASIDLKVYLDQNCTIPVTAIDFGNIETDGTSYYFYMYVKNEGLGYVTARWNSTRSYVTDRILDFWERYPYSNDLNGTIIGHGTVLETRYRLYVYADVDPGSYSWTLYLGAEQ